MKFILLFLTSITVTSSFCQTKEEILNKYDSAINSIKTVSYKIQRIDTLLNNVTENKYGEVTMIRDEEATITGFKFFADCYNISKEFLYDGKQEFQIFPKSKNYKKNLNPDYSIARSPGGLLIVPELVKIDRSYDTFSLLKNDKHYVLSFHFPYDSIQKISDITKLIYLNKNTFLPEGIIKDINDPARKVKYFKFLKEIVINDSKSKKPFKSSYLFGYEELAQRGQAKHLSHLLYNKAPGFKLRDMEGNWIVLSSFEGKVVLLDFWATWCKPCITSLPKVEAIHEKYKDQGLVILGILKDVEKRDQAENIIENAGSSYKTLLITPSVEVVYRANKIPQYVIVNRKGVITYADSGFSNDIESHIQRALAE